MRSFLLLQPRGGDYGPLIAFFREQDVLGKAVQHAGARSAEVQVPLSGSGPVMVTAVWDSAEAYAGWRTHPIRAELGPGLEQVVEGEATTTTTPVVPSGVYEVVIAAARQE